MLAFLTQNMGSIVICTVLAVLITAIVISLWKGKKKGQSSCGGGCQSCPMECSCHHKK